MSRSRNAITAAEEKRSMHTENVFRWIPKSRSVITATKDGATSSYRICLAWKKVVSERMHFQHSRVSKPRSGSFITLLNQMLAVIGISTVSAAEQLAVMTSKQFASLVLKQTLRGRIGATRTVSIKRTVLLWHQLLLQIRCISHTRRLFAEDKPSHRWPACQAGLPNQCKINSTSISSQPAPVDG